MRPDLYLILRFLCVPLEESHVPLVVRVPHFWRFSTAWYGSARLGTTALGYLVSYRQKKNMSVLVEFEVFTKCCYLNPLLAIPMLQIVIKHQKLTLFIHFLRRTVFSAHFWMTAAAHYEYVYCCKAQYSSCVNIYIEFSMTRVQTS